ncbi:[LysW]-lysine hydrolase [Deinococcus misasensis]|uniref:[LysW]-lysine hydrolase n=1 Tax=Deinococcus misasensis TaxID=392413 RepID=UPI00054EF68C|nr:[LysW]-lysine hydrolase [Deinococcus misasensis]
MSIELLRQAVAIPSVSYHEADVAKYLAGYMGKHGFENAHVDVSGSAIGERGNGPLTVVLLGHIDTVPGDIQVRIEDGKLYGRGSVDAKGSFCTFVSAVQQLPESALQKARFVCIGATEEEAPTSRGARHAVTKYTPNYIFIGEPSSWDAITLGYKGRLIVKAEMVKDNFHTAGEGTSASDDVVEFCTRVKKWAQEHAEKHNATGAFNTIQVMVQSIHGDADGMQQVAKASVGLRLPPGMHPSAAQKEIFQLKLPGMHLQFVSHEVPYRGEKDTPISRALRLAIREVGGTPKFKVKTGTSDMNVVAPHWDAPMVAYGPGDSALDHTPFEHLELAEYEKAIEVLKRALIKLVGA